MFVSNNYILVKFKDGKSVIFSSNGIIKFQQEARIQQKLDSTNVKIVGESLMSSTHKFVLLKQEFNKGTTNAQNSFQLLKFDQHGNARMVSNFLNPKNKIKDKLQRVVNEHNGLLLSVIGNKQVVVNQDMSFDRSKTNVSNSKIHVKL